MVDAEETKRFKAKQLRYKKPIVKNLNLEFIQQDLWDIQEECEEVRWYTESEDGTDSLINSLAGDEDKPCTTAVLIRTQGRADEDKNDG